MTTWIDIAIGMPLGMLGMYAIVWTARKLGIPDPLVFNIKADPDAEQRGWMRGYADGYLDCDKDQRGTRKEDAQ